MSESTLSHRITKVNTYEEFEENISHGLVICEFTAEWCEPCQIMKPLVQTISNIYSKIKFIKVDVDELYDLCVQFGVGVAPTFYVFKDGIKIDELVGGNQQKMEEFVKNISKLIL